VFRPASYDLHKVETAGGTNQTWIVTNRFEHQPLRLRIETLMAAGSWEADTNIVLADATSISEFTNSVSAPGVRAELMLASDIVRPGSTASLRFSAANGTASARGAWTKVERVFNPPLNLSKREGLGVWIHGDG